MQVANPYVLILMLATLVLMAIGIYWVATTRFKKKVHKPLWILLILLMPWLGTLLWALLRDRFKVKNRISFR